MPEFKKTTKSLCPVCMKKIDAQYIEKDGKIYLEKTCKEHGSYRVLVWSNAQQYKEWEDQAVVGKWFREALPASKGCPFDCGTCSEHTCGMCTAVLEITYQCNMNCEICFADAKKEQYHPSIDKIKEMYETTMKYGGDCSVQLSGGEPTVRDDLPEIVKMGKDMGFSHIQINTNGIRIAQSKEYLQKLKDAGADLIYLQFDGTNDDIYQKIRGRDMWEIKQKAIQNCEETGIGVMLVPVVVKNVNNNDIGNIIQFAKDHMPTIKGVHFQPVSYFGRYPDQVPPDEARTNLSDVISELETQTNGEIQKKHIVPRKPYDAHCSFSGLYYLDYNGKLQAITKSGLPSHATKDTDFAKETNKFTNEHWRMKPKEEPEQKKPSDAKMGNFLERLAEYTFSLSGMGFQDIWNFDIKRLKGCCVFVITADRRAVPLCAFHVTNVEGKRLYSNSETI